MNRALSCVGLETADAVGGVRFRVEEETSPQSQGGRAAPTPSAVGAVAWYGSGKRGPRRRGTG